MITLALFAFLTVSTAEPKDSLILVHPPGLADAALEWAKYRDEQGWTSSRIEVAKGTTAEELQRRLREAIASASEGRVSVLLLGDVGAEGIPTFYFPQEDPQLQSRTTSSFASDQPYQLLDDRDALPDVALGRVPVASTEQALAVLAKIQRYERDATLGPWRQRVTYLASEGRFGAYDVLLEGMFRTLVTSILPDSCDFTVTYASPSSVYCPPPSKLNETAMRRLGEPAILFNYLGHGFDRGLDQMRWRGSFVKILTAEDVETMTEAKADLPIALLGCCSSGWYDLADGQASLSEAMLTAPGAPVAVIAGSRITHPYATAILQKDVTRFLLEEQVETVGELDLKASRSMMLMDRDDRMIDSLMKPIAKLAKWHSSLQELRLMHSRMYNLIGDPATRIAQGPKAGSLTLAIENGVLRGGVSGMVKGEAVVLLETGRDGQAKGDLLQIPTGADDADLEAKAQANAEVANDRVVREFTVSVADGALTAPVQPFPPGVRLIRVWAHGVSDKGLEFASSGALRVVGEAAASRPAREAGLPEGR